MPTTRLAFISIITLTAMLSATGIHHIFRLGVGLIIPTLIAIALGFALWALYAKTRRFALLTAYGVFTALIVFWFGFLDGFLDHVVKAAGLDNITFLPGSEAEVVATSMRLWSQQATTAFYEGTGILSAILALLTAVSTGAFIYHDVPRRAAAAHAPTRRHDAPTTRSLPSEWGLTLPALETPHSGHPTRRNDQNDQLPSKRHDLQPLRCDRGEGRAQCR